MSGSVSRRRPAVSGSAARVAISRAFRATRASPPAAASRSERAQAPLGVGQRAVDDPLDLGVGKRLEPHDAAARQQGVVDLERRVLGGGADQDYVALLDRVEHSVLLALVEPVDLVDEQDAADAGAAERARLVDSLPQVGDPSGDGREGEETSVRGARDDARQRRLAAAGRAPEDERGDLVGLDGAAEQAARADEVCLAHELVEGPWPQASGQRGARRQVGAIRRRTGVAGRGRRLGWQERRLLALALAWHGRCLRGRP